MPRKQFAKSAARKKQASKKATNPNQTNNVAKFENDFFAAPAKIAEQLAKEVTALKQKEAKLIATLSKIEAQATKIEKTIAASKNPATAAARKQIQAAKKALNDTKKDLTISNAALKATSQAVLEAEIRFARAQALAKYLKDFDKTFATQAKKLRDQAKAKAVAAANAKAKAAAKANKKAKKKTKSVKRRSPVTENSQQPVLTVIEELSHDTYDTDGDASQIDDAKQVAS